MEAEIEVAGAAKLGILEPTERAAHGLRIAPAEATSTVGWPPLCYIPAMLVGSAKDNITPFDPQVLGSGSTAKPISSVRDNLETNVVTLAEGDFRLVIITLDLLYPGRLIRDGVESALSDTFASHEIFMAASHTHTAPAVTIDKPLLGTVDTAYTSLVVTIVVACVRRALASQFETESLMVQCGYADSSINRRSRRFFRVGRRGLRFNKVDIGLNPDGPRNETVTTIVVGPLQSPHAVIWNYSCHPTSAPLPHEIGSHFPGVLRDSLRRRFSDENLPILFLQGFSGDIRPPATEALTSPWRIVRRLLLGKRFGYFEPEEYSAWVGGLVNVVSNVLSQRGKMLWGPPTIARVRVPLSEFVLGAAPGAAVTFHGFSFGTFTAVGVSAELVAEYLPRLQSFFPGQQAIGIGCIDDTFGYVPTASMLGTGGYEDFGFCRSFELEAVQPTVEQAVMHAFAELARRLSSPDGERRSP